MVLSEPKKKFMPLFNAQSSTKLGLQLQLAWHKRRGIGGIHPNKSAFLPRIPAIASDHDMVVQCIALRGPMTDFAAVSGHLKLAAAAASSIAFVHFRPQPHKLSDQIFLARTICVCICRVANRVPRTNATHPWGPWRCLRT